jgi:hypothetical protein
MKNYNALLLYEYESLSLALTEEHMLGMSENRMLRIFDPKKE